MDPIVCNFPLYDYGRCGCGDVFEARLVEVRMTVAGEEVLLTQIPQGVCVQCGTNVFKAEVLELVEATMAGELPRAVATTPRG